MKGTWPFEVDRGPDLPLLVLVPAGFDSVGSFLSFGGHFFGFFNEKIKIFSERRKRKEMGKIIGNAL